MKNQASTSDITAFLQKTKMLISTGNYDFVPRKKNMQSLALYGLTIADAKDELLELKVEDYYMEPKPDIDTEKIRLCVGI